MISKVEALAVLTSELETDDQLALIKKLLVKYTRDVRGMQDPWDKGYAADDMLLFLVRMRADLVQQSELALEGRRQIRNGGQDA